MTTKISAADYHDATESYMGWCPVCKDFTRDSTEPDAEGEGYECPAECGATVVGAENALVMGLIEIGE